MMSDAQEARGRQAFRRRMESFGQELSERAERACEAGILDDDDARSLQLIGDLIAAFGVDAWPEGDLSDASAVTVFWPAVRDAFAARGQ